MTYVETHSIEIPPITLPAGVTVSVSPAFATGGAQQNVSIVGTTSTSKEDTIALLEEAFALLMAAASAEGVGQPVFSVQAAPQPPAPVPTPPAA